jgi:hypothetical protein
MPKTTIDLEMTKKKMEIVANHSGQGDKVIIIVPKEYHNTIKKFRNPLHITVEEIIE